MQLKPILTLSALLLAGAAHADTAAPPDATPRYVQYVLNDTLLPRYRQLADANRALASQLRAEPAAAPRLVVEFSRDIPYYMQLADYFIGKPGPGSLSEAVQQGLPVIVVDNAWTMPQERYNADWVREHGLGVVHDSLRTLAGAVEQLTRRLDEFRANVGRIDNRALFEIPPLLSQILEHARAPSPA